MLKRLGWTLAIALVLGGLGTEIIQRNSAQMPPAQSSQAGDPATLQRAYATWRDRQGNGRSLILPLAHSRARSAVFTAAQGVAKLDLATGLLEVDIRLAEGDPALDLWMIDGRNSDGERSLRLGVLRGSGDHRSLKVEIDRDKLKGFQLDRLVVAIKDVGPADGSLLIGSPSLFQRLFYDEVASAGLLRTAGAINWTNDASPWLLPFAMLVPTPAFAATGADLADLVAEGEVLFNEETFEGNGRTCAACHPASNNFTIDAAFISTLGKRDPLFIAENKPALRDLENPALMREFGLILANVDGFEDPTNKFVMRSVPHLFGMALTIQSNATEAPFAMTGWSGDGAPGSGRLRDFTTGAVTQHFTNSLDRVAGVDFRLPTETELDAMEAFMLSLGRQEDPDLDTLRLVDVNAERGRKMFIAEDSQGGTVAAAKCGTCHGNAGALTVAQLNPNFETGTEDMPHAADLTGELRPRDDGFGTEFNPATGGFGDNHFNPPSLVEAADTGPFFHHNAAATLEDAISFYDSRIFRDSVEGQRLLLSDTGQREMAVEVDALAAFLRVVNVLDNLDAANDRIERARLEPRLSGAKPILTLALADIDDAVEVLVEGDLHEAAWDILAIMRDYVVAAKGARKAVGRNALLDNAIAEAAAVVNEMVDSSAPTTDVTPPVVFISDPLDGDSVIGNVSISANASDDIAVSAVTFAANGVLIGQDLMAPFNVLWNSSTVSDGAVQITATATDTSNNTAATSINITVENDAIPPADITPPSVSILSPVDGTTVLGNITITASATDDDIVDVVVFKVDSVEIGQSLAPPYEQVFNTLSLTNGAHQISATAVDASGNAATASVAVSVSNAPCTVYSCPNPPDPSSEPTPDPVTPDGSSPDGEFNGVVIGKDPDASTVTISSADGDVTVKITSETVFKGSIAGSLHEILIGHVAEGEFFTSTEEVVWINADMPPGL